MIINLKQAEELVKFFGGDNAEATLVRHTKGVNGPDGKPLPDGLYAYITDYPEEGGCYLGPDEI